MDSKGYFFGKKLYLKIKLKIIENACSKLLKCVGLFKECHCKKQNHTLGETGVAWLMSY